MYDPAKHTDLKLRILKGYALDGALIGQALRHQFAQHEGMVRQDARDRDGNARYCGWWSSQFMESVPKQAYARSDLFEKRRALMESWARYLDQALGDVIELPRMA